MQLYINDILVELDKTIPFPLTFQISDIRDLSARKGSSSKTITLPGTRINSNVMSTVYALTTSDSVSSSVIANFDPSIKAKARYYQDGILQFEGIIQLKECIKKNGAWRFNMVMFADQIDIMSLLKNYKIKELGWSEYNHNLTALNQSNSWTGIIQKDGVNYNNYSGTDWLGEGYYYGLIDYGMDRLAPSTFETDNIPLQIFVKSIVDKMFEKIGVTYDSTFFDSQLFKKLLMAYEGGVLPNIDASAATTLSIESDQINFASGYLVDANILGYFDANEGQGNYFFNDRLDEVLYSSDSGTNVDPSSQIQSSSPFQFVSLTEGDFELNYSGTDDVELNFTSVGSTSVSAFGKVTAYYRLIKNNATLQTGLLWTNEFNSTSLTNSFSANFDLDLDVNLNNSDSIKFRIDYHLELLNLVTDGNLPNVDYKIASNTSSLDIAYSVQEIQPGSLLNIKSFLPDMDCFTFFKGLVTMFNLYVKPDADNPKNLSINPLGSFYNGSNNALNWTDLLDESKEIKVTPTVNFASKEYQFGFADDKDYWNARYTDDVTKQYGAKSVKSGSQFATTVTKMTLPFSNKLLGEIPETNLVVPRNFQVKTDEDGVSEITQKKGKPFIVQIKNGNVGTMQTGDWTHVNELDVATVRTSYPYVGHLDDIDTPTFDLQFDVPSYVFYDIPAGVTYTTNNLWLYHEKFIKELIDKNGKMLSCSLRLNANHINSLNFGDLINIDGVVYRLQKIAEYNSNDDNSSKSELIRIIEGEGIQTYTIPELPVDPYIPPSIANKRITEDNNTRTTTDDELRIIQ